MNALVCLAMVVLGAAAKPVPYEAKLDGFKASFPGTPKVETTREKGVVTRSYTVDADHSVYLIIVTNDPEITLASTKDELDSFRESSKSDSKITADRQVTLGPMTGLELKTKGKDMDMIARMFVGTGRTWTVVVDVDHGHSFSQVGATAFLDSFAMLEAAATPAPVGKPEVAAAPVALAADGVEVVGWAPDGSKVAVIQHGIYDGKGTPWAKATVLDTRKNTPIGATIAVELENEGATEAQAVAEAKKKLNVAGLVPGKTIKSSAKGELTAADGSPIGNLVVKSKKASKKQGAGDCPEPFVPELLTVQFAQLDTDGPVTVLQEKKVPARRACSSGCEVGPVYGQAKGGLFVLHCQVRGFEGPASEPFLVTTGSLEYPLEADLP